MALHCFLKLSNECASLPSSGSSVHKAGGTALVAAKLAALGGRRAGRLESIIRTKSHMEGDIPLATWIAWLELLFPFTFLSVFQV